MRLSQFFTHTLREDPKDETTINAKLLIRGGFVFKNMAGVWSLLPLGVRVMKKIEQIIREEMDEIGGQELHLNILQDRELWQKTGRWAEAKNVMYQFRTTSDVSSSTSDVKGQETGLGFTHEEVVAQIATQYIHSYRDLPKHVYQIQTKFRNEPRAQAGLLRGREFGMKDLYSLTATSQQLDEFYEQVAKAYLTIFKRLGLEAIRTEASGGLFSKRSHEFQVMSDAGEDTIYVCKQCSNAINKEITHEFSPRSPQSSNVKIPALPAGRQMSNEAQMSNVKCQMCGGKMVKHSSIEVGNIFKLGTRFSEPLGLYFTDKNGARQPVTMGSYGIGTGRAMGTIVEVHHDDKGIIWPETVAPFQVHLIEIRSTKSEIRNKSQIINSKQEVEKLYKQLTEADVEVLYDDREDVSAGEKFADADLIGCPYRLVVSEKTLKKQSIEMKYRKAQNVEQVTFSNAVNALVKD